MTIAAILRDKGGEVITLTAAMTVADAVTLLADRRIGAAPVLGADGAIAGIFSERDVIGCLHAQGANALASPVSQAMTSPAVIVSPDQSAIGALSLMTRRRIRHLPVIQDGQLVGLVSIGDLVKYRIDRIEADAAALRDYIQSA